MTTNAPVIIRVSSSPEVWAHLCDRCNLGGSSSCETRHHLTALPQPGGSQPRTGRGGGDRPVSGEDRQGTGETLRHQGRLTSVHLNTTQAHRPSAAVLDTQTVSDGSRMVMLQRLVLLLLAAVVPLQAAAPEVTIRQGHLVGRLDTSLAGESFYSFQGIPYAKPPVGALRFKVKTKSAAHCVYLPTCRKGHNIPHVISMYAQHLRRVINDLPSSYLR